MYHTHDCIHGHIVLSPTSNNIIKHPYFQRLKNINQLGGMSYTHYLSDHNRFNHSIGVAYLARKAVNVLSEKYKDTNITESHKECVEIAGLCHDIGHWLYSHASDHIIKKIYPDHPASEHEYRSMTLTRQILNDLRIPEEQINFICYLIDRKKFMKYHAKNQEIKKYIDELPKEIRGLADIINSINEIDVDKLDYIPRDAYMLKIWTLADVNRWNDNINILIQKSKIIDGQWVFHAQTKNILNNIIYHRWLLFQEYYLSHISIIFEQMISDVLLEYNKHYKFIECFRLENKKDMDDFTSLDDSNIFKIIITKIEHIPDLAYIIKKIHAIYDHKPFYTLTEHIKLGDSNNEDDGDDGDDEDTGGGETKSESIPKKSDNSNVYHDITTNLHTSGAAPQNMIEKKLLYVGKSSRLYSLYSNEIKEYVKLKQK